MTIFATLFKKKYMVSVDNLKVEFGVTPLFEDVSYVINKRDRIALVGKNGAGKSTMLKILAGMQQPTSGVVAMPKEITVGYLPQVMILSDTRTVMEEAEMAFDHIFEMQDNLNRLNQELADRTDYESESYQELIDKFTHENERFQMMGGMNYQAEIERTLMGLGFSRNDFDRSTSEFSGGWRMRIELAKLLLRRPDVLLLDEPTNHLDIESIQWLENFLRVNAGAVVLVSHDRAFINNVTNRTIEITCGRIYDYKVPYDEFVVLRKERREQQLRAYENQQKQIQDTFHERGFTFAVLTHEGYFLASLDGEVHIVEDGLSAVCFLHVLADNRVVARTHGWRELESQRRIVLFIHFDSLYLFQLLDAALHLHGLGGLVSEPFDKVLCILNLLLLVFVGTELLFASFLAKNH